MALSPNPLAETPEPVWMQRVYDDGFGGSGKFPFTPDRFARAMSSANGLTPYAVRVGYSDGTHALLRPKPSRQGRGG